MPRRRSLQSETAPGEGSRLRLTGFGLPRARQVRTTAIVRDQASKIRPPVQHSKHDREPLNHGRPLREHDRAAPPGKVYSVLKGTSVPGVGSVRCDPQTARPLTDRRRAVPRHCKRDTSGRPHDPGPPVTRHRRIRLCQAPDRRLRWFRTTWFRRHRRSYALTTRSPMVQLQEASVRKRHKLPGGNDCPKCKRPMQRFKHGPSWKPKARQPYFFAYWDICKPCRHIQMYEKAKVFLHGESEANCGRIS